MKRWFWRAVERWYPKRYYNYQARSVYDAYQAEIDATTGAKERDHLESLQQYECSDYWDELARIESLDLMARAARVHIDIEDILLPAGETSHWITGNHGTRFIHDQSRRALAKSVGDAEYESAKRKRERLEMWIKCKRQTNPIFSTRQHF